jgi:hypothetical protein
MGFNAVTYPDSLVHTCVGNVSKCGPFGKLSSDISNANVDQAWKFGTINFYISNNHSVMKCWMMHWYQLWMSLKLKNKRPDLLYKIDYKSSRLVLHNLNHESLLPFHWLFWHLISRNFISINHLPELSKERYTFAYFFILFNFILKRAFICY